MKSLRTLLFLIIVMVLPSLVSALPVARGYFIGKSWGYVVIREKGIKREYKITHNTKFVIGHYQDIEEIPKHSLVQVVHSGSEALTVVVLEVPK